MNATTRLCKEGLLKLVALLDKLPAEADINRASAEWNGAADVLLNRGLDEVAAAYALEIKERRFEYEDAVPTSDGGEKKSPLVNTIEAVRRDILAYSDRLCLNPKAEREGKLPPPGKRSKLEEALRGGP